MVQTLTKSLNSFAFMSSISWWKSVISFCHKDWFTNLTPVHNKSLKFALRAGRGKTRRAP